MLDTWFSSALWPLSTLGWPDPARFGMQGLLDRYNPSAVLSTAREIISHSIQSYTATMCNRVRGVTGPYWQNEAFDHWARDEAETMRIIDYIERNPETAGLVQRPEDWPFSSAHFRAARGIPRGQPLVLGDMS